MVATCARSAQQASSHAVSSPRPKIVPPGLGRRWTSTVSLPAPPPGSPPAIRAPVRSLQEPRPPGKRASPAQRRAIAGNTPPCAGILGKTTSRPHLVHRVAGSATSTAPPPGRNARSAAIPPAGPAGSSGRFVPPAPRPAGNRRRFSTGPAARPPVRDRPTILLPDRSETRMTRSAPTITSTSRPRRNEGRCSAPSPPNPLSPRGPPRASSSPCGDGRGGSEVVLGALLLPLPPLPRQPPRSDEGRSSAGRGGRGGEGLGKAVARGPFENRARRSTAPRGSRCPPPRPRRAR